VLTVTPSQIGSKKADALPALNMTLTPPAPAERTLELDELWSFVHDKKRPCPPGASYGQVQPVLDLGCIMCGHETSCGNRCRRSKHKNVPDVMASDSLAVQAGEVFQRFLRGVSGSCSKRSTRGSRQRQREDKSHGAVE
jgi:hypothetical protein